MKDQIKYMVLAGLVMLLLPLGLTALISGKDAIAVKKQMDMEVYLPMILCGEIPWEYEEEALKTQAVLARSSLYLRLKKGRVEEQEIKGQLEQFREESQKENYQNAYQRMEKAVKATKGQVMVYQGDICAGVFHRVSSGMTRDGQEVLQDSQAGYLKSVDSSADIQAEEYLHGHYFTEEALRQRLKECYPEAQLTQDSLTDQMVIGKRDSQEYILEMQIGAQSMTGEEFRQKLELSSSNFTIQNLEGKIRFLCKGLGHGLGLSQYGANELAKKGKTYQQILFTYFPDVTLQKKRMEEL